VSNGSKNILGVK